MKGSQISSNEGFSNEGFSNEGFSNKFQRKGSGITLVLSYERKTLLTL